MKRLTLILALLTLGACDNPFGKDEPSMSGGWDGFEIGFTAQQKDDRTFVGSGTIRYANRSAIPMDVYGVNSYPNVSFTIIDRDGFALNFQGEFINDDELDGVVTGYSNGSIGALFYRR